MAHGDEILQRFDVGFLRVVHLHGNGFAFGLEKGRCIRSDGVEEGSKERRRMGRNLLQSSFVLRGGVMSSNGINIRIGVKNGR